MRQIWEKEMPLEKEEVRERLEQYLTEKKYVRKKGNESILFCYNGKIPHRYFQIFFKNGMLRIECWIPSGKKERITKRKKHDVLRENLSEFMRLFSDVEGEERVFEEEVTGYTDFECLHFPEAEKDRTDQAWIAFFLGVVTEFLAAAGVMYVVVFPFCIVSICFAVRGLRSSKIILASAGFVISFRVLLLMIAGVIL